MSRFSYNLRRVFWFVWRWKADFDWGDRVETGLTLGRAAARWSACARLRQRQRQGAR